MNTFSKFLLFGAILSILAINQITSAQASTASGYLSDNGLYQVPNIPRPAKLVPMTDPVFGSTVTRLTDPSMIPTDPTYPAAGLVTEYSPLPALNADKTKMLVVVLGGTKRGMYQVRDVNTGDWIVDIQPSGDPEFSWHPTDPNRLFYRYANEIRIYHVDTKTIETVMKFPQYAYIAAREYARVEDNWHYYAFAGYYWDATGTDTNWNAADLVVVDLWQKQIIARKTNLTEIPRTVGMSPKGNYVHVMYYSSSGTVLYDRNLNYLRQLDPSFGHATDAVDANGDEVYVSLIESGGQTAIFQNGVYGVDYDGQRFAGGSGIAMTRLRDGHKTLLLNVSWNSGAKHLSGVASRNIPWVLVSSYAGPTDPQDSFNREIFWLALDGSGQVKRIAHHHSDQYLDSTGQYAGYVGGKDYFAEPHAVPSWDGQMVLFNSVWGTPWVEYDIYKVTGNWWAGGTTTTPPLTDTIPPTVPANLTATAISSSQVNLSWSASTDNVGVTGYKIYRNGTAIGSSAITSYSDTGLSAGAVYSYTVSAYDAAGNVSSQSSPATATTQASITPTSTTAGWTFCANEDSTCVFSSSKTVRYGANQSYFYQTASNGILCSNSVFGDPIYGVVKHCDYQDLATSTVDTTSPSMPTNLSASAVSSSQINLTWVASTDNIGVTGYKIYRNSTQIGTSQTNSYSDTGLQPSTSYSYTVSAYDASGNVSAQSTQVSATTQSSASGGGSSLPGSFSFSLSNLGDKSITPGQSASNVISVSLASGISQPITFSVYGLPAYTSYTFSPTSCTPNCSSTLNIRTTANTSPDTYTVTVYGTGGGIVKSTSFNLIVAAANPIFYKFKIGDRIQTNASVNVRYKSGLSSKILYTQPQGALGTIAGGPQSKNGYTWWNVNYDTGVGGWSAENYLALYSPGGGASSQQDLLNQIAQLQAQIVVLQAKLAALQAQVR